MKVSIKVSNKLFGESEEIREINSDQELEDLKAEFKKYPRDSRNLTMITFECLANEYFEQIR